MALNPELVVIWAAAIATLGVYTILYRENPVSRLFEHIFVGLSVGYLRRHHLDAEPGAEVVDADGATRGSGTGSSPRSSACSSTSSTAAGSRGWRGSSWGCSSAPAAGRFFREFFPLYWPQVYGLVQAAASAPARHVPAVGWADIILHHWLFVIILLTVMSYFFFSVPHEGKAGGRRWAARPGSGRWFLMIAFGAMFGNTVMARISLFIGRVQYLLQYWLGHYWPWLAHRML